MFKHSVYDCRFFRFSLRKILIAKIRRTWELYPICSLAKYYFDFFLSTEAEFRNQNETKWKRRYFRQALVIRKNIRSIHSHNYIQMNAKTINDSTKLFPFDSFAQFFFFLASATQTQTRSRIPYIHFNFFENAMNSARSYTLKAQSNKAYKMKPDRRQTARL